MRILLALVVASAAWSQAITITASPAPAEVSPLPKSFTYSVYVCADEAATVQGARVEAALVPLLRITPKALAVQLVARRTSGSWQSRVLRVGGLALSGATMITGGGLVAASPRVITALAMATTVAPEVGARLRESLPMFDSATLLDASERLDIPAGGCAVRQVIAKRGRSLAVVKVEIRVARPARPQPSAIPTSFVSF